MKDNHLPASFGHVPQSIARQPLGPSTWGWHLPIADILPSGMARHPPGGLQQLSQIQPWHSGGTAKPQQGRAGRNDPQRHSHDQKFQAGEAGRYRCETSGWHQWLAVTKPSPRQPPSSPRHDIVSADIVRGPSAVGTVPHTGRQDGHGMQATPATQAERCVPPQQHRAWQTDRLIITRRGTTRFLGFPQQGSAGTEGKA
ncbi:hypothetical protein MAPG_07457 [Magnaporthiopsis poae ATCC 64411]|uniref:Uncharacterized protein n=1 Tax=Magnaporthiopsis poae (strain ATCC 64411 / 73-15) TaxID=644358 RepID=A0A0C4E4Q8_MAGP6|nr:hypothetical protein MAPG_07457 [Magnaporthiopsis poae ATCC 64411]